MGDMSQFVVGQWVECVNSNKQYEQIVEKGKFYRVKSIEDMDVRLEGIKFARRSDRFRPFSWQVGRTYRTMREGVTVRVTSVTDKHVIGAISDTGNSGIQFDALTGFHTGNESTERINARDLTPYLADEPSPAVETTEPSNLDPINPPHYQQHPSGVECITVTEHFTFNVGNAIKYLWRAGLKGDAVTDLEKAAWYLEREIKRLKGGA